MTTRGWVLLVSTVVIGAPLALPLAVTPLRWAKALGWAIPDDVRLTRYFGRCLGIVLMALGGLGVWAAFHPEVERLALAVGAAAMLLNAVVHVVGAVERAQPRFEN